MTKIITIGSATMDVFVECDEANIVSVCSKDKNSDYMSYPYGSKIDISTFASNVGGGGINTACNFANLGFDTSAIFKIGKDFYADGILHFLKGKKINLENIVQTEDVSTGFSVILVSFQGDRTVLTHRGANAVIDNDDINYEAIKEADLIYIAPLNGESNKVLEKVVDFAEKYDMKKGMNFSGILSGIADVLVYTVIGIMLLFIMLVLIIGPTLYLIYNFFQFGPLFQYATVFFITLVFAILADYWGQLHYDIESKNNYY